MGIAPNQDASCSCYQSLLLSPHRPLGSQVGARRTIPFLPLGHHQHLLCALAPHAAVSLANSAHRDTTAHTGYDAPRWRHCYRYHVAFEPPGYSLKMLTAGPSSAPPYPLQTVWLRQQHSASEHNAARTWMPQHLCSTRLDRNGSSFPTRSLANNLYRLRFLLQLLLGIAPQPVC